MSEWINFDHFIWNWRRFKIQVNKFPEICNSIELWREKRLLKPQTPFADPNSDCLLQNQMCQLVRVNYRFMIRSKNGKLYFIRPFPLMSICYLRKSWTFEVQNVFVCVCLDPSVLVWICICIWQNFAIVIAMCMHERKPTKWNLSS